MGTYVGGNTINERLLTSAATLAASVEAASRLGCVQTTVLPPWVHFASCKYCVVEGEGKTHKHT